MLASTAAAQSATATFAAPSVAVDPAPDANSGSSSSSSPTAPTTPASSSDGTPSNPSRSPSISFPALTQGQANGLFDGFLVHGFQNATDGIRRGLQRLIDDANLVTNTAPDWTYQQPTVVALQRAIVQMSNGVLALVIFWMGLDLLLHSHLGGRYLEVREVAPRLVLGAALANSAAHWTALAIDLNNAACAQLIGASSGSLTDLFGRMPTFDNSWLVALLLVAFLAVWAWLYIKMAGRMAMLLVLLVLAPAAQLCWILPQTRGMADRWHQYFWTTLYAQVVVAAALKLAWGFAGTNGGNPITLLITLCLLFLAANSPELLAGGVARIGLGSVVEAGLFASRASSLAPAAGAASLAGARGATSGTTSPASAAAAVPRVMANPVGVSGQGGGTGAGIAVETKGFGRGGRPASVGSAGDGTAATDKASGFPTRGGRAASQ
jgi:hypothetical protein